MFHCSHPFNGFCSARYGAPVIMALSAAIVLAACGQNAPPAGQPGSAMPPAEVGVVTVTPTDVGVMTDLPGRLEASRVAQIRARVAGVLHKRLFVEGSDVRAGQPLFQIDASPYEAALSSAQASLAKAEANVMQAAAQADRFKPLLAEKAISQQEFINAQAAHKQAQADVAMARAAVETARINVGYANITAPIAGRIGRGLVTEGALVGQGEATPLALVQQIDPIYVNFTQSAADVMKLRQHKRAGQTTVRVLMEDGSEYAHLGKLLFSDLTVDSTSGQVTLRAVVPNPQGILLPGLFVRVRMEQVRLSNVITLPQQAVTRSPQGDSVMVVSSDGKVVPRPVKVGAQQNGQWIIVSGLATGEQVMVDGFQKLRGPAPVKPMPWQAKAASAPASSTSAAHQG